MTKNRSKQKLKEAGITLIALVVTIIILLILAGVTLSLVLGNQGLIGRAQQSSNTMAEATRNEMKKMNEYVDDVDELTTGYINPQGGGESSITVSDYGKIASWANISEDEEGKWRLFYSEGSYAYLIRDNIGDAYEGELISKPHSLISEIGKSLNSEYHNWDNKVSLEDYTENEETVSAILNPENWTEYKDAVPGAEWAVGGPSVEMFVKSYNATHTDETYIEEYNTTHTSNQLSIKRIGYQANMDSPAGYNVGINESGGEVTEFGEWATNLGNTSDIDNAIYCSSRENWWLASPGRIDTQTTFAVFSSSNGVIQPGYNDEGYGVRPIVAVPASSIGTTITLGEI